MNATAIDQTTYRIPSENLGDLQARIAKLARKAAKLGTESIGLQVLGRETETVVVPCGIDYDVEYAIVAVTGAAPKVAGWTFIATLEHDNEAQANIVRGVPGAVTEGELVAFRNVPQWCDHCRTARRRIDTFVLRHDNGEHKQVGRNCLRDFLGHHSPEDLARMAELLIEAAMSCEESEDEGGAYGPRQRRTFRTRSYLEMVAATVRRLGFVSRAKAQDSNAAATADQVDYIVKDNADCGSTEDGGMGPHCHAQNKGRGCGWDKLGGHVHVIDADVATAEAALLWIREQDPEKLNDYMYNLHTACRGSVMDARRTGLVASLIAAYNRHIDRQREDAAKAANQVGENDYVGIPGKRQVFTNLTVVKVIAIEGNYGVTHLHTFTDAAGHTLKWFASGSVEPMAEGEVLATVKATVKGHEEFRGIKQTMLTRVAAC